MITPAERTRLWRGANPGRVKENNRWCYQQNKDKYKKQARGWALLNPERRKEIATNSYVRAKATEGYSEKRNAQNKNLYHADLGRSRERVRNQQRKRKGYLLKSIEWEAILELHGHRCPSCLRTDIVLEVDHILPVSKGGRTIRENIQPLCRSCNAKKSAKEIRYRLL